MKRALPLLLMMTTALALGCYPKGWRGPRSDFPDDDFPFVAGPYLILIQQGTMAVVVKHPLDQAPAVEWWLETAQTSSTAEHTTQHVRVSMPYQQDRRGLIAPYDTSAFRGQLCGARYSHVATTRGDPHTDLVRRWALARYQHHSCRCRSAIE